MQRGLISVDPPPSPHLDSDSVLARILHTSDLHLSAENSERLDGLDHLLQLAARRDVDLMTVAGDLFDSTEDAEALRPDLREKFSDRPHQILTIPGNHDHDAFEGDLYFGSDFRALLDDPFEEHQVGGARIVGVPYSPTFSEELRLSLSQRGPHDGPEVLLLHASLEAPFEDRHAGDEQTRYCPVTESGMDALGFDYVLAGHYHNVHEVRLPSGAIFLYPGTPTSVARDETGTRKAFLVDTDEERVKTVELATFHYDRLELTVRPGRERQVLDRVRDWAEQRSEEQIEAEIVVDGHTEQSEDRFHRALDEAAGSVALTDGVRSVKRVLEHPLYQKFSEALAERETDDSLEEESKRRVLRIFSTLMARGDIQ